jgi:hypothetical protein
MRYTNHVIPVAVAACLFAAVACQSSTVRGENGLALTATTPRSMELQRGTSGTLKVGLARAKTAGPVTVSVFNLPRGVKSDQSSARVETTSAIFILTASREADLVGNQAVGVTVEDPDGRKSTQFVNLSVTE